MHLGMHAGQAALGLQVQQLIVEHVAVVQVFVGPVAGQRDIQQAAVVEFPGPEQEAQLLDGGQLALQEAVVAACVPVLGAANDEP